MNQLSKHIIIVMTILKNVYLPLCDWRLAYGWGSGQVWCWRGTWLPIVAVWTFSEKCPLNIRSRTLFTNMLKWITLSTKHNIKTVLCVTVCATDSLHTFKLQLSWISTNLLSLSILVTTFPSYACSTHNHNNKQATPTITKMLKRITLSNKHNIEKVLCVLCVHTFKSQCCLRYQQIYWVCPI